MEESDIESKSTSIETSLITEVNSIDIHHIGTYLTLLCSWEAAEQCPVNITGIGSLGMEESDIESESVRDINSMNLYRIETYLTLLYS